MLVESTLESNRFSVKCGRLQISSVEEIRSAIQSADQQNYQFLSVRIPTNNVELVQKLENFGFYIADTLVYYKRDISTIEGEPVQWHSCLNMSHLERDVVAITELAFKDYPSHYAVDSFFSKSDVEEVYLDWARRSCVDRQVATDVIGQFVDDQLVAFASVKDQTKYSEILLAAVHPQYQGQGLLQKLLAAAAAWAKAHGHNEIYYSTQIQNIAAQKALARQGWEMSHSLYTLHRRKE